MHDKQQKSVEIGSNSELFSWRLEAITSSQLTARNLDTYADDALNRLVELVQDAVTAEIGDDIPVDRERESAALAAVGLDPETVEKTLDHIADVAYSTKRLDALLLRKTELVPTVLVAPDPRLRRDITPGDGNLELPKEAIPKLKTLLLLLETEFDVDLDDDEAFPKIIAGPVSPNMMRSTSYRLVQVPSLERTVLVCDEVGNTTFVFDQSACSAQGIAPTDLYELNKTDLKELIAESPQLGAAINYSQHYVDRLAQALSNSIDAVHEETVEVKSVSPLKPKAENAPEGYLPVGHIAKQNGFGENTIKKAIAELGDELGDVGMYRSGTNTVTSYSPEQIDMILDHIGRFEKASKGYLSVNSIAKQYSFSGVTIKKAIAELGDELGDVGMYRSGTNTVTSYSPEQIDMILDHIGRFEKAPEGYLPVSYIATKHDFDVSTIQKAIAELGDELGDVGMYRFRKYTVPCYSPEQINMILNHIGRAEKAPEGYLPVGSIARRYDVNWNTVKKAIDVLGDELGDVHMYWYVNLTVPCYSPEQIKMILDHLGPREHCEKAPDGYLAVTVIAKQYGANWLTVKKAIVELGAELGDVRRYQFVKNIAAGYSPEQINMILNHIGRAEKAPEDYLSVSSIATQCGTNTWTIKKAIHELGDELGDVDRYRFGAHTVPGYSPEQIAKIVEHVEMKRRIRAQKLGAKATSNQLEDPS